MHECMLSHSVMSNSLWSHGLQPGRLLCPWDFPSKNTRAGYHFLLQGIFLTQGLNSHRLSSALEGRFFTTEPPGKPQLYETMAYNGLGSKLQSCHPLKSFSPPSEIMVSVGPGWCRCCDLGRQPVALLNLWGCVVVAPWCLCKQPAGPPAKWREIISSADILKSEGRGLMCS